MNKDKKLSGQKSWRDRNKDRIKEYDRKYTEKRYELFKAVKDQPCLDCGQKFPHYVMEFDHVTNDKLTNVSSLRRASWEKIAKEIEKCEIVCANCHRTRTFKRRGEVVEVLE